MASAICVSPHSPACRHRVGAGVGVSSFTLGEWKRYPSYQSRSRLCPRPAQVQREGTVSKTPMTDEVERFHSYGRLHNHAMELERALNECEAALQKLSSCNKWLDCGDDALATIAKLR